MSSVINYPDVLGALTGGQRLNLNLVQIALAVRPAQVPAGQPFEVVVLLQNACDADVDVVLVPVLPGQDAAKQKNRFAAKSDKLRVGLRPAEVGFVILPILTNPQTAPSAYPAGLSLDVQPLEKKPQMIRDLNGGGRFSPQGLSDDIKAHLMALRGLRFSADASGKKNYLQAPFTILPPAVSELKDLRPAWTSLWTLSDFLDEYGLAQRIWPQLKTTLASLKRDQVFMPLFKWMQARFQASSYPLQTPEALFITKQLTLILEMGAAEPTAATPRPPWPRWFVKLCHALYSDPSLQSQIETLVTQHLFADLVYDSVIYAFASITTILNEEFGTPDEIKVYAVDIVNALLDGKSMDFARAYLPLILGGLIVNTRVTMPKEQVRDTVNMLLKALEGRGREKNADNDFIFDIANELIDRAIEHA